MNLQCLKLWNNKIHTSRLNNIERSSLFNWKNDVGLWSHIQYLVKNKTLILDGRKIDFEILPSKFNWKKFTFEPTRWVVIVYYCYSDLAFGFPIFYVDVQKYDTEKDAKNAFVLESFIK